MRAFARRGGIVALGLLALLTISTTFFLLDAVAAPLPAASRQAILFLAFAAGLALEVWVLPTPSRRARRRWLRTYFAASAIALIVLLIFYSGFVRHRSTWPRAYVVSWSRSAECLCAPEQDAARCIEVLLSFQLIGPKSPETGIATCWGRYRVGAMEAWLAVLYFLFAMSVGAATGAFLPARPPIRVFVSYRRGDGGKLVRGPLVQALKSRFEAQNIFVDQESIPAGAEWAQFVRLSLKRCDACVAVISPRWWSELDQQPKGERDWVRFEIRTAIDRRVGLVALVIGGAEMPEGSRLPGLEELARLQAVTIDPSAVELAGDGFEIHDEAQLEAAMDTVILAIESAAQH